MKKTLFALLMLMICSHSFAMELNFAKGFFKVPWGTSPEETVKILGLKENQIADADSRLIDKYISFSQNGIRSNLFFYRGKLWYFTRSIDLKVQPDPKSESIINVFTKKLHNILKDEKYIQCTVSSSQATHVFNGPPEEETPVTITIAVANLKLKKEIQNIFREEKIREKETVIDTSLKKLLNQ